MTYESNKWLEKYEIKGPDYDYIDRPVVLNKEQAIPPKRFVRKGNKWESIESAEATRGLFGIGKSSQDVVRIMFTGDITCFERQLEEAQTDNGYDFNYVFSQVKDVFAQSDLAVGNLETMIVPEAPYRTEFFICEQTFHCNAPIEFLEALQGSGLDLVTNANNHDMDTGAVGIGETIDMVEHYGLIQTGTFKSDKPRFELFRIKGINIAITSFAMYHNYHEDNFTEEGRQFLLSSYDPEQAEKIAKEARKAGADVIIACMHWGQEYKTSHNSKQTSMATELARMGYDVIIGSHPHVLQDFEILSVDGRNIPVFYSMGNFVTHHVNNPRARTAIACVEIKRKRGKFEIDCSYVPVCVSNSYGDKNYIILPLKSDSKNKRNMEEAAMIRETIGEQTKPNAEIEYPDLEQRDEIIEGEIKKKKDRPKLRLKSVKEWPVTYDAGKFVYNIFEEHAEVVAISEGITASALTISNEIRKRPITGIAEGAFEGKGLRKCTIGLNVQYVGDRAYKDCTNLEGVFQFSGSLQWIGESAFENCVNLGCIVIKDNIKSIHKNAYKGCTGLRSAKIASGTEFIADDAFENCDRVVFYCSKGSYAYNYAETHGIKVVEMNI